MISFINTSAAVWTFIMMMACIGIISDNFDTFMANLILAAVTTGGITLLGHRIYTHISNIRLDSDLKKTAIERERAEIENIRQTSALPRHYLPGGVGVTPTPTPLHPPENKDPDEKYPVFKDGQVVLYANDHKKARIANMYFERNMDGTRKHTITDIAIAVHGGKGGWQNGNVKEVINEMKDFYGG